MMRIDLAAIDRTRFHVNECVVPRLGDMVLVVPHKAMWTWGPSELHLRSLLCRPTGDVVSSGFPKFFNFGEDPMHDAIVTHGLSNGLTSFTEKVDGSLIIRSVIDGVVHFRTRGCELVASNMREEVERTIRDRYPTLLDPSVLRKPFQSLLMEFVSPANQVVVRYDEPRLVTLGRAIFEGEQLIVAPVDASPDLPELVRRVDLPTDVRALKDVVSGYDDREGIVTWTTVPHPERCRASAMHLSKFKSAWYLRLHSLRSQTTPKYIKAFCYLNGVRTLDQLKVALMDEGFDWEVASFVEPLFQEFMAGVKSADERLAVVDAAIKQLPMGLSRKDIAMHCKQLEVTHPGMFGYMMARATADDARADEIADALRLGLSAPQLRTLKTAGLAALGSGEVDADG
jgi:hypothetical protein